MKSTYTIISVIVIAGLATGYYLHAQSAPKFSREDALELQLLQKQLNEIQVEANKQASEIAQKKAQPIFDRGVALSTKICAANGFTANCYIDAIGMKVLAKAPERPADKPTEKNSDNPAAKP